MVGWEYMTIIVSLRYYDRGLMILQMNSCSWEYISKCPAYPALLDFLEQKTGNSLVFSVFHKNLEIS